MLKEMNPLITEINKLKNSEIRNLVNQRLIEFKSQDEWFSELCFCILTANSKASTALNIQAELCEEGFLNASPEKVKQCIVSNKHRFHNNKTKYIVEARECAGIKKILSGMNSFQARDWLVKNIKGLGMKEASHFLRNVGYTDLAILDRHILRLLAENNYIREVPSTLTRKKYLEYEKIMQLIGKQTRLNQAELDLIMWYSKTGKILK
jgi:N-glycosylase/DNA lyase